MVKVWKSQKYPNKEPWFRLHRFKFPQRNNYGKPWSPILRWHPSPRYRAARYFTYCAIQAIKPVINENINYAKIKTTVRVFSPSGHNNCPQARYQRQSQQNSSQSRVFTARQPTKSSQQSRYNISTQSCQNINKKRFYWCDAPINLLILTLVYILPVLVV